MSRSFMGGNSQANRAISGRQRGEPEYGGSTPEVPTKTHPALPVLESITSSMTKGTILEKVDQAKRKLGG
jgi:hypothetical protein